MQAADAGTDPSATLRVTAPLTQGSLGAVNVLHVANFAAGFFLCVQSSFPGFLGM